ncbi:MAG: methyl-accepting chemotaxis protein [Ignavibacteriaceae bacterium]|nr:methyl-accepting chemotaxis protein [Ignavibacteriaceae bacterium]
MMKFFNNLSTKIKLFVSFGVIIVIFISLELNKTFQTDVIWEKQQKISEQYFEEVIKISSIKTNLDKIKTSGLELVLSSEMDANVKVAEIQNIALLLEFESQNLLQTISPSSAYSDEVRALLSEIKIYADQFNLEIIPLVKSGKSADAIRLEQKYRNETNTKLSKLVDTIINSIKNETGTNLTQSRIDLDRTEFISLILMLVSILLSIYLVIFLNSSISAPLKKIAYDSDKLAQGDLDVSLESEKRADEIGTLTESFGKMISSLQDVASFAGRIAKGDLTAKLDSRSERDILANSLNMMAENLKNITKELLQAVSVVSSSSSEILAGTSQLSATATETATAVSETTATVEEVKQTSFVTRNKAKFVAEISQKAVEVSISGKDSTQATIEGIHKIGTQMEMIAESIIKLSEQSRAIAEIISVVKDIAEQTNLLAVNASIEAARAGEQGKGFVVVAQEIKSLADQSKLATTQVRAILNEIQNAISATVMATEQGSKTVEAGIKQSTIAGDSIRTLTDTIEEAAQAAFQIEASSQQQFLGMDQVVAAMENIKVASSQNASTTHQLEGSVQNLKSLGENLRKLTDQFKV